MKTSHTFLAIPIRRVDPTLPLPEYKTRGAVAFDLASRETVTIEPHSVGYLPLNICLVTPPGYMLLIAARSSLHKRGLMMANGVGIGDQDFCGNDDEWRGVLLNFTNAPITVERGERILQGMFISIAKAQFDERQDLDAPNRGGLGSTGSA